MSRNLKRTALFTLALCICVGIGVGSYIGAGYISPTIAHQRFDTAWENGDLLKSITYGERTLSLYNKTGDNTKKPPSPESLYDLKHNLLVAHFKVGDPARATQLLKQLLKPNANTQLSILKRLELETILARVYFLDGQYQDGLALLSSFVDLAGDIPQKTYPSPSNQEERVQQAYAKSLFDTRGAIEENLGNTLDKTEGPIDFGSDNASQLASANQMVKLGAYYALDRDSFDAAIALLITAYDIRKRHLPQHSRDITAITFILGPLYIQTDALDKAEQLYLDAFFAQQDVLGESSDEFSLYIKMLADIYEQQGRKTQSQALYNMVRTILINDEDIFLLVNNDSDNPNLTVPASKHHSLPQSFKPDDLVPASAYGIATNSSRNNIITNNDTSAEQNTVNSDLNLNHEVSISLGLNKNSIDQNDVMPTRLAHLMGLCASDTRDENITIALGYSNNSDQGHNADHVSEHQTGLAVDININGRLMRQSDSSWLCFIENGWKFGFILSYPQNNHLGNHQDNGDELYENNFKPWHWRYIGTQASILYRAVGPLHAPQDFLTNIECVRSNRLKSQATINHLCNLSPNKQTNGKQQSQSVIANNALLLAEKTSLRAFENGPAFVAKGRFKEAQSLYVSALKAQEDLYSYDETSDSENPALGFYVGLLADIYERQGMTLHAQSLKAQMYSIIYNAHYRDQDALNDTSILKITQPVTQSLTLKSTYLPNDLVAAFDYNIPVSKDPNIDEMKLRFGQNQNYSNTGISNSLPANLSGLIQNCMTQSIDEKISLRSGYRSYTTQAQLYERLRHRGTVTPPGISEHQTGLTADIDVNGRFMKETDKSYECFTQTAHQFGFILSYPKGNTYLPATNTYEPWHWRYVGVETATLYHQEGPKDHPQEFLASLQCYRDQSKARASYFDKDDTDYCFIDSQTYSPPQENLDIFTDKTKKPKATLVNDENNDSARILNRVLRSGQNR